MRSINNTVPEIVARYARNRHRAEFVAANPDIPEEVLAVVYFRRATNGKWWYAPKGYFSPDVARYVESASYDAKWYEIPVCPEKVKSISYDTREKYADMLQDVQS
jgi:hypothetical protein